MAKADKLVGGEKIKLPKVAWEVRVRGPKNLTGDDDGTEVTLSGEASDAIQAAIIATKARQSIMDARNADQALQAAGDTGGGQDDKPAGDEAQVGKAQRLGRH